MSDIAIKVEGLGKQYRLGEIGTGTISHDLNRWFARLRGKEDPFAKVGETNDRTIKGGSDYVWSLKDVDFEVKKGEVLGIIGRNGAGKSTLLKILSKVTAPTTGTIKVNGRIASLLEVGTGFHPELTGRENIYLNGAILGMTKAEIRSKFDEIVDFSGVERYIDTPVKRYSSGMYVRLAFAVAAFLEPEILIVDEVLAVGDAEFQKKCLGRMKDVSLNDGRTVLFVSHQLNAVSTLCDRTLLMKTGMVDDLGKTSLVIKKYISQYASAEYIWKSKGEREYKNEYFLPTALYIENNLGEVNQGLMRADNVPFIIIEGEILKVHIGLCIGIAVYNEDSQLLFWSYQTDSEEQKWTKLKPGPVKLKFRFPKSFLNEGDYKIELIASIHFQEWLLHPEKNAPAINLSIKGGLSGSPYWQEPRPGLLALQLESTIEQ